ncbi:hypothetical protein NQ042_12555 [Corynebacterium phoceense]|uniref:hypothetical protein n=1 Tax=Corynebacterium phoceense TaxID=1686286 RepID=UPI00211BD9FA|nr:hypothetical protein [Corynebacterium phoceense]MCQ9334895.1 hypothetical protein [Corynebacterium phoceense]
MSDTSNPAIPQGTIEHVADKDNLLLAGIDEEKIEAFKGATSATSVSVPGTIYERMREIYDELGVAPAPQMLNALRLDAELGKPYAGDVDETRPARGRNSGRNSHRVSVRVPTLEFGVIRERSRSEDLPVSQMFLNAWKRAHAWQEPTIQ